METLITVDLDAIPCRSGRQCTLPTWTDPVGTRSERRQNRISSRSSPCCSPTNVPTASSPPSTRISCADSGAGRALISRPMRGSPSTPPARSSPMGRSDGAMAASSGRGAWFILSNAGAASVRRSSIESKRERRHCWRASHHHGFSIRPTLPIRRLGRCSRTVVCDRSAISGTCRSTSMDRSNRARPRGHRDRRYRATGDPWLAPRPRRRIGAPATSVRHVRRPRPHARPIERRLGQRDRGDGGLRAGRDAGRQPMGSLGAHMKTDRVPAVQAPGPVGRFVVRLRVSRRREPAWR